MFSGEADSATDFSDLRFLVFFLRSGSDWRFRFEGFDMLVSDSWERAVPLASAIAGDKALESEESDFFFFFFVPSTTEEFGVSGTARLRMLVSNRAEIKCFHQPVSPKSSGISGYGSG